MGKILLFILFSYSLVSGQTETLVTTFAHSVISGQTEYYRIKDRTFYKQGNPEEFNYSRRWHNLQFLEIGSAVAIGASIALTSDDLYDALKQATMVGIVRWVVRDGVYNLNQGNGVFYQSTKTTSFLEPLGTWYVKLTLLTIIVIWNYLEL